MNRLFAEMCKMPLGLFASSMELFAQKLRGFQMVFDHEFDLMAGITERRETSVLEQPKQYLRSEWESDTFCRESRGPIISEENEPVHHEGEEFGGDGHITKVKTYVNFTREDYFQTLYETGVEDVTRPTSKREWEGRKLEAFLGDVRLGKVNTPRKWIEKGVPPNVRVNSASHVFANGRCYPAGTKIVEFDQEAEDDFLNVSVEIIARIPEGKPDYEKEQAKALDRIAKKLGP